MKLLILAVLTMVPTMLWSPAFAGIRCGNDLISIGDSSSQVMMKLSKCGEVLGKEVVSKETIKESKQNGETKKEKWIEKWHIRVKERGSMYCYPLVFEEGALKDIGSWSRCD